MWALAGGFAGFLIVALFDPHGQMPEVDSIAAVVGAFAAVGLNRVLRA